MIPESFIQEVLSRSNIVDVIGRYVKLQHKGANWMACCPFHKEKTPSFAVNASKQFFKCFGCGEKGTAITFLMKYKGLTFPEAIKELADDLGMEVPQDPFEKKRQAQSKTLTDFLALTADYYHQTLLRERSAIEYIRGRGLTEETVNRFQLGFSPSGWQGIEAIFPGQAYCDPKLQECGLVIEKDGRLYDRFRERIMFPIRNPRGQVIGFGARTMKGDEQPKYLNSPETPVYHKSQELYGLYEGRDAIHKKGRAIVCEGYMDVIQMSQAGFTETVAALGTSITPEHVRKLFQLSDHVYFSFDGDAAGFKAARRAMTSTLSIINNEQSAYFVMLPEGEDPDSLIKAQGAEAFESQLKAAFPLSKFFVLDIVREVAGGRGLRTAEERSQAVAIAKPLLQSMTAHTLRHMLVMELATTVRMEPSELATLCGVPLLEVKRTETKPVPGYGRDSRQGARYKRPVQGIKAGPISTNIKRRLLQCFLIYPALLLQFSAEIENELLDAVDEWEEIIVRLWHLASDHNALEQDKEFTMTTGYLLSFMQSDPAYELLTDMVDEPGAPISEAMAASEVRCIFYKLEMTQLNAQINEMLIQDERGERTDADYLMRLLKRRQEIDRLLNDERIGAVDVVMTQRLY